MTSNFRLGERVKHRKFVGTIVEIDDISARVFVEEQGNTRWVELDELTSIDDLAALQAENVEFMTRIGELAQQKNVMSAELKRLWEALAWYAEQANGYVAQDALKALGGE